MHVNKRYANTTCVVHESAMLWPYDCNMDQPDGFIFLQLLKQIDLHQNDASWFDRVSATSIPPDGLILLLTVKQIDSHENESSWFACVSATSSQTIAFSSFYLKNMFIVLSMQCFLFHAQEKGENVSKL